MRSSRIQWLWAIGSAVLLLPGCGTSPLSADQLVGKWVADSNAMELLKEKPEAASRKPALELKADGSMVATQVPDRLVGDRDDPPALFDGSGTWETVVEDGRQVVRLRFHSIAGRTVDRGTRLYVSQFPKRVLWFDFADPDAGRQFGFRKSD